MPFPRRPRRASPDAMKISRDGDYVIIQYADDDVATTHFKLGRERLEKMTDEEVLAVWDEHLEARDEFMQQYDYVAVEIPPGRPQVEYFERGDQWVPKGHVLRAVILGSSGDVDEPFVSIDDRDFTPAEFVKMVNTFGGWGMRITFVPDDELHEKPVIEVREPHST